jgi:aminoglycoside 6'-N-acetyltransferase
LARWLAEPHVHRWWTHEFSPEALERDFGDVIDGEEPAEDYDATLDGFDVGLIQYCRRQRGRLGM